MLGDRSDDLLLLTCGSLVRKIKYYKHLSDAAPGEVFAINFDGVINLLGRIYSNRRRTVSGTGVTRHIEKPQHILK